MAKALEEAEATKADAIKAYDALMAAKEKEVETLNVQIAAKLMRKGEFGVGLAGGLRELEEKQISVADDEKFLAALETGCATKEKERAEVWIKNGLEFVRNARNNLLHWPRPSKSSMIDDASDAIRSKPPAINREQRISPGASLVGQ